VTKARRKKPAKPDLLLWLVLSWLCVVVTWVLLAW
jgi:hypothetical protein